MICTGGEIYEGSFKVEYNDNSLLWWKKSGSFFTVLESLKQAESRSIFVLNGS